MYQIICYALVFLDLTMLVLSIRAMHRWFIEAAENTSISLDGTDSTASVNKLNRHALLKYGFRRIEIKRIQTTCNLEDGPPEFVPDRS